LTPRSKSIHSKSRYGADGRLFGVTTLDVVRSSRFLGEIKNKDPKDIEVTVVGGHSGVTIVPLLSQTSIGKDVKGEEYKALVKRIQFGGDEVVQAKAGTGSATLSMGFGEFSLDYHNTSQTDMISRCTIRQLFDPSFER
jgi:malate/lactate dehydrogenase